MKATPLSEQHSLRIDGYGTISLNAKELYNQCKEYYNLLGQEIGILPKKSTVTKVTFESETYQWLPFQKYITMWVFYSEDENNSGGNIFDLPLDIVLGTKTLKECAIMELESRISDYKGDLEALKDDMTKTKKNIQKTQKQLSKIQNS